MNTTTCKPVLVACATLAFAAQTMAAEVTTRVFGEAPAASGKAVVTRAIGERSEPSAGAVPFAISLLPDLEAPSETWSVCGLRINLLAGRHHDVAGFDIGLLGNVAVADFDGIQVAGFWNSVGRSDGAWQTAGFLNRCECDFHGLQTAGFLNVAESLCEGAQIALANNATDLSGLQIGLWNHTDRGSGVQIGLINSAYSLEGLQIGVINVNRDSTIPFCPVINFAF